MTLIHLVSLLGLVVAVLGMAIGATWVWTTGLATFVTQFAVAETPDPGLKGFLAFLSVPVILVVAVLPT